MARSVSQFASALALALVTGLAPAFALAAGDTYKQHMDNGVKLYADKNFSAAIAEFSAAYELKPNPSPLVNIALCDKELFRYPLAIAALTKALTAHADTMEAADKKAAEEAIKEMSALLGTVKIAVEPKAAKVTIDGEVVAVSDPVPLGPGKHQIVAQADGYANGEASVIIASGREQAVTLTLVAEKGAVTIEAPDARLTISVDDVPVGQGRWSGMLPPGQHIVRMYGADGATYGSTIVVSPGAALFVNKDQGGVPLPPTKTEEPARRGLYIFGLGSMLFAATHPPDFPGFSGSVQKPDYGAAYGLRAGWQVNKWAGFEASYEHSSIYTYGTTTTPSNPPYYRIVANRVAGGLRLVSVGDSLRFAGSFGGGITADQVYFNIPSCPPMTNNNNPVAPCYLLGPGTPNHVGVDAFLLTEAALEIDIDRVLVDVGVELQVQSTGNLEAVGTRSVFGSLPLINAGPAIRIGYRFW